MRAIVALIANANPNGRPHVRLATRAETIVTLAKATDRRARLLAAEDKIVVMASTHVEKKLGN